jgi:antitoxin component of MazEF toxin-antitoxin module
MFLVLGVGCDETKSEAENAQLLIDNQGSNRVAAIIKNSTYLTDDSRFVNEVNPNEKGEVEITDMLIENGYLTKEKRDKIALAFVTEGSMSSIAHLQVSYWIDKQSNMLNLRVVDPDGKRDTYYQRESIENILTNATNSVKTSKGEVSFLPLLLRLFSVGLRVCSYTNCLDSDNGDKSALNLNNLYINYNNKVEKELYRGTVADFYMRPEIYSKLPLILDEGGKDINQTFTATGAVRLTQEKIETELLHYLEKVSENRWLNPNSKIRVDAIEMDGNNEVLVVTIEKRVDEKLYDLKLNVVGHVDYNFDGNGIFGSVAPEFFAKVKINGVELTMLSGKSSYTSSDILKNVPLQKGDELEVTIYDNDTIITTYWDEIHTFKFRFDGKKVLNESRALTTTLEFLEEGKEIVNNAPKYAVNVTIKGDADENKDEGGTAPDFSGAIYIDGKAYTIKKQNNRLVNQQVVKDVPINMGDNVTVVIMEEDVLWTPEMIMKHSFTFDANDVVQENKRVEITLEFEEQ